MERGGCHCSVQRRGAVPQAASPRGTAEPPALLSSPLQGLVPLHWGPPGPAYLVAAGAGAAVEAEGVVVAGALVLAGAGEAGVALGLDAQGGWACGTGGAEMALSAGSDGEVSV